MIESVPPGSNDGSVPLLSREQLLVWAARRCGQVFALGIERREVLLTHADLRLFEPPLVVVEWDVVVRLGLYEVPLARSAGISPAKRK